MSGDAVLDNLVVDRSRGLGRGASTLVLLNSLGTTTAMWDAAVPLLTESFDVVRFDLRGHGAAAAHPATSGLDDLVGDLFGVLDRIGVARAHLAGLSIGGMIALRAAARKPDRVGSVTAMCCAAVYDRQGWLGRADTVRRHGLRSIESFVIDRWFTEAFRSRQPDVVRDFASMLGSVESEAYAIGCDVLADADIRPDLARITARTLIIGGAEDPATPPYEQRLIAGAVPHARLEILPAVAHLAPAAEPERIVRLVTAHALDRFTSETHHDHGTAPGAGT